MKKREAKTKTKSAIVVGRQAPSEVLSPKEMLAILESGTLEDKVRVLRRTGILDSKNKLKKLYTDDWGSKVTRTPDWEDACK